MTMPYAAIVSLLVQRGLSRPEAEELADSLQWHEFSGDAHSQVATLNKIAELYLFVGMAAVNDFIKIAQFTGALHRVGRIIKGVK